MRRGIYGFPSCCIQCPLCCFVALVSKTCNAHACVCVTLKKEIPARRAHLLVQAAHISGVRASVEAAAADAAEDLVSAGVGARELLHIMALVRKTNRARSGRVVAACVHVGIVPACHRGSFNIMSCAVLLYYLCIQHTVIMVLVAAETMGALPAPRIWRHLLFGPTLQVQARGFDLDPQGQHFLPWLHWASFSADCPHQLGVEACPDGVAALLPGGSPECIMWRAGSDVRRGDTPCAPRSPGSSVTLAPDVAAVVHGVVLADAGASSLSLLDDEHQAAASTAPRTDAWSLPWQQAASKHSDLAAVLDALKADEEAVAKMVASPEDEGGAMLAVLRAWRAQRRTALERALVQQVQ